MTFKEFLRERCFSLDKLLHIGACYFIATIVAAVLHLCGNDIPSVWGVVAALVIGLGKEIWDAVSKKGTPSGGDFVADILGCILAVITHTMLGV